MVEAGVDVSWERGELRWSRDGVTEAQELARQPVCAGSLQREQNRDQEVSEPKQCGQQHPAR